MRKIILFAGLLLCFTTCNSEKKGNASLDNEEDDTALIIESDMAEMANVADANFTAALRAFQEKDYNKAAEYINMAIQELKAEDTSSDAQSQQQQAAAIADLDLLAKKIKSGQITSDEDLLALFAYVDIITSRHYLLLTQIYAVDQPEKSRSSYQKAATRMEQAAKKLEGEANFKKQQIL